MHTYGNFIYSTQTFLKVFLPETGRDITRLAQSVERLTLNQVVEGSSPSVGVFFWFCYY